MNLKKRILALLLALTLTASLLPSVALADEATDEAAETTTEASTEPSTEPSEEASAEPITETSTEPVVEPSTAPSPEPVSLAVNSSTTLAHGATLVESSGTNAAGNPLEERVLLYTPGQGSSAMVAYGSSLRGLSTAKYVSNWLTTNGYEPVAGANGDFYMTDTGIPIGIVATDGVLRSSDRGQYALGILADGSVFIGKPSLSVSVATASETMINIDYVNKTIQNYGTYLLNSDYSATSRTNANTLYIRLSSADPTLKIGSTIVATATEVFYSTEPVEFKAGELYLAATVENSNDAKLAAIKAGEELTISITAPDPIWAEASYAVGGGDLLVDGGEILPDLDSTRHPRTAVGVRADGSMVLCVIDGRRSGWSVGVGLGELALRMKELGCVTALNLDGGGSSALVASYPGLDGVEAVNRPSDGQLRAGANYIFIVNTAPELGEVANLGFYGEYMALAGTSVELDLRAWDANFHTMALPDGITWSVSGTNSTVENGVFTAGSEGGTAIVTATYGSASASVAVEVIGSPDEIKLYDESNGYQALGSIVLNPSETIDLRAECIVAGEAIDCTDEILKWSFSGDAASVDASGVLTLSNIPGKVGTLTVSIGSTTARVRVTVGEADVALESFEGSYANIEAGGAAIHASIQSAAGYVALGSASGKITYNFGEEEAAGLESLALRASYDLPSNANFLRVWVYGDGSGNTLTFSGKLGDGSAYSLGAIALDFVGYKQISLPLPENAETIDRLTITLLNSERPTGTIYLDQLVAGRTETAFATKPSLENIVQNSTITPGSVLVTATLADGGEPLDPSDIRAELDGERVGFYYDAAECLFVAILADPDDGLMHRFTVFASDADGNLMRRSIELNGGTSGSVFADASAHWSAPYVDYLYELGVLEQNYATNEAGESYVRPRDALTRVEFAVMMANFLGIDTSRYDEVVLPYTDMDLIPTESRGAVVAMYLEGIITGKSAQDGSLFFDPLATIKRAEIMTIIGRTLPKGYGLTNTVFTDAADIPEYAREHISRLVGTGIVEGYDDGSIKPLADVTRGEGIKMLYEMY